MVKGTRTHRALFLLTVLQYNGNLFKSLTELFIQEKRKSPIDSFSIGGLLLGLFSAALSNPRLFPHFRPFDDTFEHSLYKLDF